MKNTILPFIMALVATPLFSQDGNRSIGLGLQSSFPTYGISARASVTERIQGQAILAPFGGKAGSVGYTVTFYGLRGIYRFTDVDRSAVPYGFAGAGLIRSKFNFGSTSTSTNLLGWNVGAGVELFPGFLDNMGASIEIGYGALSVSALGASFASITYGFGLHYYFN